MPGRTEGPAHTKPISQSQLVGGASNEWMNYKEIHVQVVPVKAKVVFLKKEKSIGDER